MKTKIKMQVLADGSTKIVTIEGAGTGCKAIADKIGSVLGAADESSRETTPDYYIQQEGDQHVDA